MANQLSILLFVVLSYEFLRFINGKKLIIMETTESQANISELDQRLANLSVEIIRLSAEANNKKPVYDGQLNKEYPELV